MPEGGAPYPEEIIESVLASGTPTAEGIMEALNMGGFAITQAPPEAVGETGEEGMPLPPPEAGPEMGPGMGPEMGAPGEAGLEGGSPNPGNPRESILIAVRGAMDEDKKRKSKGTKEAVA